jgi:hypothetical protein
MVERSNKFGSDGNSPGRGGASNSPSRRQQPMGAGIGGMGADPYKGDEENYQNDFRKTFITEN